MKKFVLPLFSCLLVLSLLLGSFATAKAAPGDDPTVTPVSGDTDFTTEVIAIASLPGTTTLDEMIVPVGFPAGEAQFGGNGILVKGFDSGKATACFSLSAVAVNEGWGGKVAVWDGAKWVRLATSITIEDETNTALACATIAGNGTYAFIKYVTEPDKLPVSKPLCEDILGEEIQWHGSILSSDPFAFTGPSSFSWSPLPWPGTTIQWSVINSNGNLGGTTSGSQVIDPDGVFDFSGDVFIWTPNPGDEYPIFTIRLDTPFCYQEDPQVINWD